MFKHSVKRTFKTVSQKIVTSIFFSQKSVTSIYFFTEKRYIFSQKSVTYIGAPRHPHARLYLFISMGKG